MSSNAQRMVDIFLGAATPKEPDALAAASRAAFKAAMEDEAGPRRPFSIFVDGDAERAGEIAGRMAAEAHAMDGASEDQVIARALEVALEAAPGLPAGTAEHAVKLFVTHDPVARNLRVPSLLGRMTPSFLEPIMTMKSLSGDIVSDIGGVSTEEEDQLAWFREDPVANEHHEHWHLVYPIEEKPVEAKRRRGEMFFYMHQQMLARYDTERLTAKLDRVQPHDDYDQAIEVGYKVGKLTIDRIAFADRPDGAKWVEFKAGELRPERPGYTTEDQKKRRDRFYEAIEKMELHVPKSDFRRRLEGHGGSDLIGNTNEVNHGSVYEDRDTWSYYGNHHGLGHLLSANIGRSASGRWGIMYYTAANIRDPYFWRWHKHIDDLNFAYQEKLAPHEYEDAPKVTFGGGDDQGIVLLETKNLFEAAPRKANGTVDIAGFVGAGLGEGRFGLDAAAATIPFKFKPEREPEIDARIDTVAELRTEMRQGVFELYAPDFDGQKLRFPYLWHRPFHYGIRLRNDADEDQKVTVRLFLCPAGDADGNPDDALLEDRRLWIEMDKFTATLEPGKEHVLVRDDKESTVIRRPAFEPEFITDLHYPGGDAHADVAYCECGWPYHLLVPRGSPAGMRFALLAIVTDDNLPKQGACGSMSFCGVKNDYPDPRPMGYPFDRPLAKPLIELAQSEPSFALRFITIRHEA